MLLLSLNTFLALFSIVLILLRYQSGKGSSYIVQYRSSLGFDAYERDNALPLFSFIAFALLVLAFHTILSIKIYTARRHFATAILGLSLLLLVISTIVSNALLELQ